MNIPKRCHFEISGPCKFRTDDHVLILPLFHEIPAATAL
jgi:hypothetical protein